MEWLTHVLSAAGGAIMAGVPLFIWAWKQIAAISTESKAKELEIAAKQRELDNKNERDDYELDKVRKSDAYAELRKSFDDFKVLAADERKECRADVESLTMKIDKANAEIRILHAESLECAKKSAMQDVEIFKLQEMNTYLQGRVNQLGTTPALAGPAAPGNVIAGAVKEVAKEAIEESKVAGS